MSDLDSTTTKPVDQAPDEDDVSAKVAGKRADTGKGKAVEVPVEEDEDDDDDDDDDEDDDEDDEDDDDEDDFDMDEVDPTDIIPYSSRRSARSGQIDYSSEEANRKAGLVSGEAGAEAAAAPAIAADDDEDDDFKADEAMDDDD